MLSFHTSATKQTTHNINIQQFINKTIIVAIKDICILGMNLYFYWKPWNIVWIWFYIVFVYIIYTIHKTC